MQCILMRHHSEFPIMPLLLRLLRTVFCRASWNFRLTRASPTLPLCNVTTLMAPNFFLVLLASMYLVLYVEIKILGTAYNKTALLLFFWIVKNILTIIYFINLNQYFHLLYQLYLLTVYYIIFISLQYVLAWQCHLQGLHT